MSARRHAVKVDHVLLAVADLATAADEIEDEHGLEALEGGQHPEWGTANRIVPLGDAYLELVTVIDATDAARSQFGRWIAASQSELLRPVGWAVRTDDLDGVATRLGLTVSAGSRTGRDGEIVGWRVAGIEEASADPALPFFIEWGSGTRLPGRAPATHAVGEARIVEVHVNGDLDYIQRWLGAHEVPIDILPGRSEITAVILRTTSGKEIALHAIEL